MEGIDYDATSAPVVSKDAIHISLALAAQHGWHVEQFDVNAAYLYATLDKTMFMQPPAGFLDLWGDRLTARERELVRNGGVLRLNKSLYCLNQSGRLWY